jgi:GNAT superfamily N-acetyltransferase
MTAAVEMRRATPADAPAMAVAHADSIHTLGPACYSAELVEAWAAGITPDMYVRAMRKGEVFFIALGAVAGQPAVLGFASHNPAGGDDSASCYVRGSAARQGIGSALWRLAEGHARAQGAAGITIEASLAGLAFYRAQGFVELRPCDVVLRPGVSIPCVIMRKNLTGAPPPG